MPAWCTTQQICEFGDGEEVFHDEECLMRFSLLKIFSYAVEHFDFCLFRCSGADSWSRQIPGAGEHGLWVSTNTSTIKVPDV